MQKSAIIAMGEHLGPLVATVVESREARNQLQALHFGISGMQAETLVEALVQLRVLAYEIDIPDFGDMATVNSYILLRERLLHSIATCIERHVGVSRVDYAGSFYLNPANDPFAVKALPEMAAAE